MNICSDCWVFSNHQPLCAHKLWPQCLQYLFYMDKEEKNPLTLFEVCKDMFLYDVQLFIILFLENIIYTIMKHIVTESEQERLSFFPNNNK